MLNGDEPAAGGLIFDALVASPEGIERLIRLRNPPAPSATTYSTMPLLTAWSCQTEPVHTARAIVGGLPDGDVRRVRSRLHFGTAGGRCRLPM